jgi:hypothetical protein
MRVPLAFVALAACKGHHDAPPAPAPAGSAAPTAAAAPAAPAVLAPGQKLTFSDFWTIAGVTRADTLDTVQQKWGKPDDSGDDGDGGKLLRYVHGPAITFRNDKAIQIDFALYGDELTFAKTHPDAKLTLLGMPCDEAAKHLAFTDAIEDYTTCKHYDANGWMVDFTAMCTGGKVSTLVVVWVPLGDIAGQPLPADHCGMPKD